MESNFKPFISIIVPFLNAAPFLKETIESVLQQLYTHWELLLIDDGSNDESSEIAKSYALLNPGKIFYYEHAGHINKGVTSTRNLGVAKASGDWIAFLDADDLWLPQKLLKQVEILELNKAVDALCEATQYWHNWQTEKEQFITIPIGVQAEMLYHPPQLALKLYPLGKGTAPSMCGVIIRTRVLKSFGGFDDSFSGKNQLFEDQAFLFKIYLSGKVYISSLNNNLYRQRNNSLMHTIKKEGYYIQGRLYFLQWLRDYLHQKKISNHEINQQLKKEIFYYQHPLLIKGIEKVRKKFKWWTSKKFLMSRLITTNK